MSKLSNAQRRTYAYGRAWRKYLAERCDGGADGSSAKETNKMSETMSGEAGRGLGVAPGDAIAWLAAHYSQLTDDRSKEGTQSPGAPCLVYLCRIIGHAWQEHAQRDDIAAERRLYRVTAVIERTHCRRCGRPNPAAIPNARHHAERIKCPKCGTIQGASVKHTAPFWSYAHECPCGYWITESEWETVPNTD